MCNKDNMWEIIGYVKASYSRNKILIELGDDIKMPSQIAKATGIRPTQVSSALTSLKKEGLIECLNDSAKKGRLYRNTDLGLEILKYL